LPLRRAARAALLFVLAIAAPASASYPDRIGPRWREQADTFAVPLRGPLFERFGYDRGRLHAGIDIAVLGTDEVRAVLPGVVTSVGYLPNYSGYGNVVKIRHDDGIGTMYAHLAAARVHVGEYVERAEPIARAGCTGSCTGPHLHFEVRRGGRLVDPLRYLEGRVR
jgi:murein DD-endopeptidase MepM/ murein hydrolase activator NlpD